MAANLVNDPTAILACTAVGGGVLISQGSAAYHAGDVRLSEAVAGAALFALVNRAAIAFPQTWFRADLLAGFTIGTAATMTAYRYWNGRAQ